MPFLCAQPTYYKARYYTRSVWKQNWMYQYRMLMHTGIEKHCKRCIQQWCLPAAVYKDLSAPHSLYAAPTSCLEAFHAEAGWQTAENGRLFITTQTKVSYSSCWLIPNQHSCWCYISTCQLHCQTQKYKFTDSMCHIDSDAYLNAEELS